MKLTNFIESYGPKKLAVKLGVDPAAISKWKKKKSFPRPKILKTIYSLSKGRVTYKDMVEHFLSKRSNK